MKLRAGWLFEMNKRGWNADVNAQTHKSVQSELKKGTPLQTPQPWKECQRSRFTPIH